MNFRSREPIADSSHKIWKDIDQVKEEMGWSAWLKFLMSLDKKKATKVVKPG